MRSKNFVQHIVYFIKPRYGGIRSLCICHSFFDLTFAIHTAYRAGAIAGKRTYCPCVLFLSRSRGARTLAGQFLFNLHHQPVGGNTR
jgi:hypothetical protein